MRIPRLRHVVTCVSCGYREATPLTRSYGTVCPFDGLRLEHTVAAIDDTGELRRIRLQNPRRRFPPIRA